MNKAASKRGYFRSFPDIDQAPVFSLPFRETSFFLNVRFSDSSCLSVSRKLPAFFHERADTLLRVQRNRGYTRERERERDIDTKILPLGNVMRPEQMRLTRKKTRQHIGRLKSLDKIEKMESRVKTRRRGLVSDITENITSKCLLRLSHAKTCQRRLPARGMDFPDKK